MPQPGVPQLFKNVQREWQRFEWSIDQTKTGGGNTTADGIKGGAGFVHPHFNDRHYECERMPLVVAFQFRGLGDERLELAGPQINKFSVQGKHPYTPLCPGISCFACPMGQFADEPRTTTCSACLPGEYQNTIGNEKCKPCTSGRYQDSKGQIECRACPAGNLMISYTIS